MADTEDCQFCWSIWNPNLAISDVSNKLVLGRYFHIGGMTGSFKILPSGIQHVVPAAENKTCTKLRTCVAAFNSSMWWSRRQRSGIFVLATNMRLGV